MEPQTRRAALSAAPLPEILVISGSPQTPSKTARLAEIVAGKLTDVASTTHLRLGELPADDLLRMRTESSPIAGAMAAVARSAGLVIATPTFKASFSGLTKLFLDLLPQFALAGKVVLPLATGGSLAHVLALDYALRPVIQSMGVRCTVPGYFVTTDCFVPQDGGFCLTAKAEAGLDEVVRAFRDALAVSAAPASPYLETGEP